MMKFNRNRKIDRYIEKTFLLSIVIFTLLSGLFLLHTLNIRTMDSGYRWLYYLILPMLPLTMIYFMEPLKRINPHYNLAPLIIVNLCLFVAYKIYELLLPILLGDPNFTWIR